MRLFLYLLLGFGAWLGLHPTSLQGQAFSVELGADTLYACLGEPYTLQAAVSGGQGPYSFQWSTASSNHDTLVIVPTGSGGGGTTYEVLVIDANQDSAADRVVVVPLPECVFPGDGNGDRVSDMRDVLAVGHAFGAQGPARPEAHLQWIGQAAPAWGATTQNVDHVHADMDGNGGVEMADLLAVDLNYTGPQDTGLSAIAAQGVSVGITYPGGNYSPGDTLVASVWFATDPNTADSLYGIAFSVAFDQAMVSDGSVSVDYSQSDLGQWGQDLAGRDQVFQSLGQIDVGLTRLDQVQRRAYGRVADIIVVIDDITGKRVGIELLAFSLTHITLVDQQGNPLVVSPFSAEIPVEYGGNSTGLLTAATPALRVYPQPTDGLLQVAWPARWSTLQAELFDAQGRLCQHKSLSEADPTLDLRPQSPGLYVLRLQTPEGVFTRRVLRR